MQAASLQVIRMITAAVCRNCKGSGGCRSHPYLSHTNIAKNANFVSDYQHSIPYDNGINPYTHKCERFCPKKNLSEYLLLVDASFYIISQLFRFFQPQATSIFVGHAVFAVALPQLVLVDFLHGVLRCSPVLLDCPRRILPSNIGFLLTAIAVRQIHYIFLFYIGPALGCAINRAPFNFASRWNHVVIRRFIVFTTRISANTI